MIISTSDNFNSSSLVSTIFAKLIYIKHPCFFVVPQTTNDWFWQNTLLWTELQKSNAIVGSILERLLFTFNFKYFFNSSFEFQAIYWPSLLGYFTWGENFLSAPLLSFRPLPSKRIPGSCPGSIVLVNIAWKIFALTQSFLHYLASNMAVIGRCESGFLVDHKRSITGSVSPSLLTCKDTLFAVYEPYFRSSAEKSCEPNGTRKRKVSLITREFNSIDEDFKDFILKNLAKKLFSSRYINLKN